MKKYTWAFVAVLACGFGMLLSFQNCSKSTEVASEASTGTTLCQDCGQGIPPEGSVQVLVSNAADFSTATSSFNYATDTVYVRVVGSSPGGEGCIASYGDTTCDSGPTATTANSWRTFSSNTGWVAGPVADSWQYTAVLNGHSTFVAAPYKICAYNPSSVQLSCTSFVVTAPAIFAVSKMNGGAAASTFTQATDSIYMRLSNAGPHAKACLADYIPSRGGSVADLAACDSPFVGTWVNISSEWSFSPWVWNFNGWGGHGDHLLRTSPYFVPGQYKSCVFNPDTQGFGCQSYTIQ